MPDEAAPAPTGTDDEQSGPVGSARARAVAARAYNAASVWAGTTSGTWVPIGTTTGLNAITWSGASAYNFGGTTTAVYGNHTMTLTGHSVDFGGLAAHMRPPPPRQDRPRYHGNFCGRRDCPCATPDAVCEEFCPTGEDGVLGCARCGWNETAHEVTDPDVIAAYRGREIRSRRNQQDERERAQRDLERERERHAAATAAETRGRDTLRRLLTAEQRDDFDAFERFFVTGSHGGHYRIRPGTNGNVDFYASAGDGTPAARLCAHPELSMPGWRDDANRTLPLADVALAQLLHITTDEPGWLAIANVHRNDGDAFGRHVAAICATDAGTDAAQLAQLVDRGVDVAIAYDDLDAAGAIAPAL